jgi:hypothetical protein
MDLSKKKVTSDSFPELPLTKLLSQKESLQFVHTPGQTFVTHRCPVLDPYRILYNSLFCGTNILCPVPLYVPQPHWVPLNHLLTPQNCLHSSLFPSPTEKGDYKFLTYAELEGNCTMRLPLWTLINAVTPVQSAFLSLFLPSEDKGEISLDSYNVLHFSYLFPNHWTLMLFLTHFARKAAGASFTQTSLST